MTDVPQRPCLHCGNWLTYDEKKGWRHADGVVRDHNGCPDGFNPENHR